MGCNRVGLPSVKQVREASFRIEDVIDEYLRVIHVVQRLGCGALICKITSLISTTISRHQIANEIQDIKLSLSVIKERSERCKFQPSQEQPSSSSTRGIEESRWHDPRMGSLFIEETEIVGFEFPRDEMVGWLLTGEKDTTVISMVKGHFDCRACITVSQSYTLRGLFIDMIKQFCKETKDPLPQMLHEMEHKSLIYGVRQYLEHKRYLIFFDDVWHEDFCDQVELARPNNNKSSRIIITTRVMHVVEFFKKPFPVYFHNLKLLPPDKAWELFCKKAFRLELDGQCPTELEEDYSINHNRLTRQWIAEGFVKYDGRKSLEQVADEYLSELIYRSLVQVSTVGLEGKAGCCQVHDLLHEVIIRKVKDLSFAILCTKVMNRPQVE
ncbi:Disease resistance protein RPM1 [Spatholobus suberectus]|nr:Disease resistance protein RPM1 [Spatholobus suberectus]